MSLTIELSPFQERLIREAAEREGVSLAEITLRALKNCFPTSNGATENGAFSVAERAQEEQIFAQIHANMNETRRSLEMREI